MQKSLVRKGLVFGIIVLFVGIGIVPGSSIKDRNRDYIVFSTADSGNGTLRQCMLNATSGDTIYFDTAVFPPGSPATITISSSLPQINQGDLTIDASNAGVILNGSGTPGGTHGFHITSDGNTIKGMQILNFTDNGIYIYNAASNNIITGNTISNNDDGVWLDSSSSNTITGNNISSNNDDGVWLSSSSSNNQISGNTISNNDAGILLSSSSSNTITGNNISNNNWGIWLYSSNSNTITGNNISSNNGYGISLLFSSNNTVTGNNANSNNDRGIWLDSSSSNTVTGNNANSNNLHGISLLFSSNNTVTGNNANSNNDRGIRLYSSSNNNLLYHNNLIDNTQNAYDESTNYWDNGYPSGGNFWDDYTGIDSAGDGIGDTPYNISGDGNQDLYPFMNPYGWIHSDLNCFGSLEWNDVTPGETVTGTITVENIGEPDSLLDWEILSFPEWGNWSFDPGSGTNLLQGDSLTVEVEVIAPNVEDETFTGEVALVNRENPDDTCIIDVSLATPVNQQVINPLLQMILERFPNAFPILRYLLGL